MKCNPDISLCASWAKNFKEDGMLFQPLELGCEYVEQPMLFFLKCNFIGHSTVMLRKSFLNQYGLKYENYLYTEDFKLWMEIIKCGGRIFVEPQHLMFLRKSESQVTIQNKEKVIEQAITVKREILNYCVENLSDHILLVRLLGDLEQLIERNLLSWNTVFSLYQEILKKEIAK